MTEEIKTPVTDKAYDTNPWTQKAYRSRMAKIHIFYMNEIYAKEIANSIRNTDVYSPGYNFTSVAAPNPDMKVELMDTDTASAAQIIKSMAANADTGVPAVLNFASYKNPGGMFIEGSMTQEDSLCHVSSLYNVLVEQKDYYAWNNKNKNRALYTDRALYTPDIVFDTGDGKPFKCDVITCAAPNFAAARKYMNVSYEENHETLKHRCKFILDIAKEENVKWLVLGAWGSGVFGQDAGEVAKAFKDLLPEYPFEHIIFAVPKGKNGNYDKMKTELG